MTDNTLKIGIVCYPTPGGSGIVAVELGKSLAQLGHKVHFITSGNPSRLSRFDENIYLHKVETGEYPLFQQSNPYALSLAVKIREVAEQYDLDLVHVHYAIPHAASAFLAKEMLKPKKLRTVTTLHGTDITLVGMMPSFYSITRFIISASDAITSVSRFLKQQTIDEFKIEKHIEVINNFVDSDEFQPVVDPAIRKRLAPNGEKLVMHVSNFRKVKNLPVVVEVFNEVKTEIPARLVLVGDGPELEAVERQVARLGIRDDVIFMGDREFIADILPGGDVFLLPSRHESFGLAALEAMSCGVPVVGSDVGGLHEVIVDGETGFLCDPQDIGCMKHLILQLLRNDELRSTVAEKARARAVQQFSRERVVNEYQEMYHKVLRE